MRKRLVRRNYLLIEDGTQYKLQIHLILLFSWCFLCNYSSALTQGCPWSSGVWPFEQCISFTCLSMDQFSSVTQSCLTLCNPMDCSTPSFPVHHQLPEFTQTHVHWVGDAIQPSHPLLFPSPPAFNLSQHQGLFKRVSSSHHVAKVLEFQLQQQSVVREPKLFAYFLSFSKWVFWLHWVFAAARRLSLVVASGGYSSSPCAGLSLQASLVMEHSLENSQASVVVAHGLRCLTTCGIFLY